MINSLAALLRAARSVVDRRVLAGVLVGSAIMLSAMATAQTSGNTGGWFAGLFSTGGTSSGTGSALISQQDSVVDQALAAQAADCADGKPGTVGAAIKTAMQVHTELASATPSVETLFDPGAACFASVGQIFDLSFAIPSLASILSAVQDALLKYAQKRVCTAVNEVTGMVTSPINQAIGKINTLQGLTDINGMANSAVGGALAQIDPQLGSEYHPARPATGYTANTNPFTTTQTTFDSGTSSGSTLQLSESTAQINSLTAQLASQQIRINQDQLNLQAAQGNYSACVGGQGSDASCSAEFSTLQQAQQALASDQAALISLQQRLSQVIAQSGAITASSTGTSTATSAAKAAAGQAKATAAAAPARQPATSDGWWSSVSELFK